MNPIDAVISWVDGYDPIYQQKLIAFCRELGIEKDLAVEPTRIQQHNEIHYCLLSLRQFAPWIRTIYLITNQQTPKAVRELEGTVFGEKIKIIDQNELLKSAYVTSPVFNSISIEWLMWQIPGLSEQFLYLNDDFFLIRALKPEDFFHENRLILRGEWKMQTEEKWTYKVKKRLLNALGREVKAKTNPHRAWQEKSAQLAGWKKQFYLLPHAPFPLLKKTFNDFLMEQTDLFQQNIQIPFRHPDQTSSVPLMVHLDIKHKRSLYDKHYHQAVMVNGACHSMKKIKHRLHCAEKKSNITFVCMQSIDQAPPETQQYLIDWLEARLSIKN